MQFYYSFTLHYLYIKNSLYTISSYVLFHFTLGETSCQRVQGACRQGGAAVEVAATRKIERESFYCRRRCYGHRLRYSDYSSQFSIYFLTSSISYLSMQSVTHSKKRWYEVKWWIQSKMYSRFKYTFITISLDFLPYTITVVHVEVYFKFAPGQRHFTRPSIHGRSWLELQAQHAAVVLRGSWVPLKQWNHLVFWWRNSGVSFLKKTCLADWLTAQRDRAWA